MDRKGLSNARRSYQLSSKTDVITSCEGSHYLTTLLPDGLKRQETERQSLRFSPPIPFASVLPTEEVSEDEHEIKVKISKKI